MTSCKYHDRQTDKCFRSLSGFDRARRGGELRDPQKGTCTISDPPKRRKVEVYA